MNPENTSSAPTTDTTSQSAPPPQQNNAGDAAGHPATPPGESQFLQEQATAARQAISAKMADIKAKLATGMGVSDLMREHPWASAAAAGVAGFAVAAALVPSKTDTALKRLAAIERALNPVPPVPHGAHVDSEGKAKVAKPGIGAVLIREFANVLKPTLMSLVTAGMTAKAASDAAQGQQQQPQDVDPSQQPVSMGDAPAPTGP